MISFSFCIDSFNFKLGCLGYELIIAWYMNLDVIFFLVALEYLIGVFSCLHNLRLVTSFMCTSFTSLVFYTPYNTYMCVYV